MHDIEQAVLGALMIHGGQENIDVQDALLRLEPDYFASVAGREIYLLIKRYADAGEPFTSQRMVMIVPGEHIGFFADAAELDYSTASLSAYVELLKANRLRRLQHAELKRALKEFEAETIDSVASTIAINAGIALTRLGTSESSCVAESEELFDRFLRGDSQHEIKVPTGIKTIDSVMFEGAFRNRTLITIAGRPSMGKTSFAVYLAHHLAMNHPAHRILFYSLEMTMDDIYKKQITSISGKLATDLTRDEQVAGGTKGMETRIIVHEKPGATIDYIETTARIESARNPVGVIVVDYLGIVQNPARLENQALRQADISRRLAELAKNLNCIVIALSQVNREYANREDKKPLMSDAADSSGSERNSDVWLGIYRPELDSENQHVKNQFIVNCRKDRFGNPWEAMFAFNNGAFHELFYR